MNESELRKDIDQVIPPSDSHHQDNLHVQQGIPSNLLLLGGGVDPR